MQEAFCNFTWGKGPGLTIRAHYEKHNSLVGEVIREVTTQLAFLLQNLENIIL